jgi:hypothetical protein
VSDQGLLVAKLIVTPAIIVGVSWLERRFGAAIAGLVAGLPLTSGPVSVFLALEQGTEFSREAALGMMAGITAVSIFLLFFARAAVTMPWWGALTAGTCGYVGLVAVIAIAPLRLHTTAALAFAALAFAAFGMPWVGPGGPGRPHGKWELPMRVVVATGLVVALTSVAAELGPRGTGMLSPFPVFAAVLGCFVQHNGGAAQAVRLQRGIAVGAFSYVAFFLVVGALLGREGLVTTYLVAYAVAVLVTFATWRVTVYGKRARGSDAPAAASLPVSPEAPAPPSPPVTLEAGNAGGSNGAPPLT